MLREMVKNWWFWLAIYSFVVFWILTIDFWQTRKKEYKTRTFVERYHLVHKYPFEGDFGYDVMSFLGPPAFLIFTLMLIFYYVLSFIYKLLVIACFLIFGIAIKIRSLRFKERSK
jgi:hypothetical protein